MFIRMFRNFIRLEAKGGIILFIAAVLALIIDNSPLYFYYQQLLTATVGFTFENFSISKSVLGWVNDGLMTLFFILVGLEVKRELLEGELNTKAKAILPAIAAMGGMIIPAMIYIYCNWGDRAALSGWGIPVATDIAFSLAILSLLGSRIPIALKVFLTALAIFDDVGAILIIAIFYAKHISILMLLLALMFVVILIVLNQCKIMSLSLYLIVGFLLWLCVLKSGVHATIAGIIIAFTVPLQGAERKGFSPLKALEQAIHPWVIFGILPLFAFANAGVSLHGLGISHFFSTVTLGIILGLFLGKQIGIFLFTFLAVKIGWARLPEGLTNKGIYGMSLVAGIGFTMSLFIGSLAFEYVSQDYAGLVRLGVLIGSSISGLFGYLVLRWAYR